MPTEAELAEMGEKWRPHRTLACLYFWRSLDNTPGIGCAAVSALERVRSQRSAIPPRIWPSRRVTAEAAGIDCVWTPELFRSRVTQATWLAAKTEKVGVATGIAWAFTRSAFILAVTALDIDEMSGGRFRLGWARG